MINFIKQHFKFVFTNLLISFLLITATSEIVKLQHHYAFLACADYNRLKSRLEQMKEKVDGINMQCGQIRLENIKYSSSTHPDIIDYQLDMKMREDYHKRI